MVALKNGNAIFLYLLVSLTYYLVYSTNLIYFLFNFLILILSFYIFHFNSSGLIS